MARRIIRIFAWTLAVLVLLVAGLYAYLRSADLSVYQAQIEGFVSRRIGHELHLDGRFELQFGATTVLVAEDVSLVNPDWPDGGELIRVGQLRFAFNTLSLLSRPFLVEELRASDLSGKLSFDESGNLNWVSTRIRPATTDGEPPDLTRIAFRSVNIEGVEWLYENPARARPVLARVEFLTVSPDENGILDLDLRGDINDLPLWADGKLGPWRNFVDGQDIFADLELTLGQARLALQGTVADVVRLEGIELTGVLSGPAIERALDRLGIVQFATGEFDVAASVRQLDVGHQVKLTGNLGQIELIASGWTDSILPPRSATYDFNITGPSAGFVAELFDIDGIPADPFQVSGEYSRNGPLIGFENALLRVGANALGFDGEVDLDRLSIDMAVTASGPDFSIVGAFLDVDGLPAESFAASGRVRRDGKLWQADNVAAQVGANRLTVNGQLQTGTRAAAEIAIEAAGPTMAVVEDFTDLEGVPAGPFDIDIILRSHPEGIEIVQGSGVFGDNRVEAQGVLALRPGLQGSSGFVRALGPEFRNVALLSGVPYLPAGAFDISGEVTVGGDLLRLRRVSASVGDMEGSLSGQVVIAGANTGGFGLDLVLAGPDLAAVPAIEVLEIFAGDAFRVAGRLERREDLLTAKNLDLSLGDLNATLDGAVDGAAEQVRMSVSANAPGSLMVQKIAKLSYLPGGPVVFQGELEKSHDEIRLSEAVATIGDYRLTANGTLNLQPKSNDSDLAFSVSGPSLLEVGRIFSVLALPDKEFEVSGQFNGIPTGFDMRDFRARVGDNDLRGEFNINLEEKPRIAGVLSSTYLDFSQPDAVDEEQAKPEEPDAGEEPGAGRLFSDKPLDTSWLQAADIDLRLQFDEFIANTLRVTDVVVEVELLDGALRVGPVFLRENEGTIEASFSLIPRDNHYELQTSAAIEAVHLGLLAPGIKDTASLPPTSGTMHFAGSGNSIRSIMASLNGQFSMRQDAGKVQEMFGAGLFKDVLLQVLRTLNPLRRERGYELLECSIFEISVKDGLASIDTFAVQTDTMTTIAWGEINLRNERLDIAFRAKPREGVGVSLGTVANELLELRGTLKSPRVRLDARRTATATGAAVMTGGLSLLARGLWDRLAAEGDICKQEPEEQ